MEGTDTVFEPIEKLTKLEISCLNLMIGQLEMYENNDDGVNLL